MSREVHVPFYERLGVQFPRPMATSGNGLLLPPCKVRLRATRTDEVEVVIQGIGNTQNKLHSLVHRVPEVVLWRPDLDDSVTEYGG